MYGTQGVQSPIVETVAVAVIISAVVAIGFMTGLIPGLYSKYISQEASACPQCGVVESIRMVEVEGQGSGAGAAAGGLPHAVAGNEIGTGRDRALASVADSGAVIGNGVGNSMKKSVNYRISIRMNDGSVMTLTPSADPGVHTGDSVKVANGSVIKQ